MNDPWRRLENPIAEQFQRSGPEGRRLGRRVPAEGVWLSWDPVRTGRVRRLGEELGGWRLYGVEFVALDPALKERINELVLGEGRSLEQRWRHAR